MATHSNPPGISSTPMPAISPFIAQDAPKDKYNVLIISTGSVASIKTPLIVAELMTNPTIAVQVVATTNSLAFYHPIDVEASVWTDEDEWNTWTQVSDPILHIELRRWADLVLIAPCSANMLAKLSNGICDNLASSIMRALDPVTPVIIFPAMNTFMYSHALTAKQLRVVQDELGYEVIGPQGNGTLACGDTGVGKMTEWTDIVKIVLQRAAAFRKVMNL